METRANYIVIGAFMLTALVGAFVFVYWLAATAERRENRFVQIVFPAPVTGLIKGSKVLFNGIKIGDVHSLDLEPNNPNVVLATVKVKPNTPLRKDTKATLNFSGLTGVAYVDLNGGSASSARLLGEDPDVVPVIHAERSLYDDIVDNARNVLNRADTAMATLNEFIKTNGPTMSRTLQNAETFSDALASNSEGVDELMNNLAKTSDAIGTLAPRLGKLVEEGERILAAVSSERIESITGNLDTFSQSIGRAGQGVDEIMARARKVSETLEQSAQRLDAGIANLQKVAAAVKPDQVEQIMNNAAGFGAMLEERTPDLDKAFASSSQVMENLASISGNVEKHNARISSILTEGSGMVANANALLAAINKDQVAQIVSSVQEVTAALTGQGETIRDMLASAQTAAANVEQFTGDLKQRTPDVDQIITDVREMATTLNATALRVQGVVDKAGAMVEGDGDGLVVEATQAARSLRKVADAFSSRADTIATGAAKFASRGSADFVAAMAQLNRTLVAIQRAVESFDRNPNRLLFGGENVPTYNGTSRRR